MSKSFRALNEEYESVKEREWEESIKDSESVCDTCHRSDDCQDRDEWMQAEQYIICAENGCTTWEEDDFFMKDDMGEDE